MASFLGTRITKHEVKDVEEKLKKIRKNYDEYDLYVYYKKVLETEKKKKLKEGERDEGEKEEDAFKPCQYVSSIYKKSEIKKKGIRDYIDKKDSIYEDLIVNPIFKETKNDLDDNCLTFFNDSISYTLLRNCGYVDEIPLGVNLDELTLLKKHIAEKKNESDPLNTKSGDSPFEDKEKSCLVVKDKDKESLEMQGSHVRNVCEEIKKTFREDVDKTEDKLHETYAGSSYTYILNHKRKIIFDKLKEAQEYEKKIEELYKPKKGFEGAYFVKINKKRNYFTKIEDFLPKKKQYCNYSDDNYSGAEEENSNIFIGDNVYKNYSTCEKKHTISSIINNGNLFNREEYLNDEHNTHELYLKKQIYSDELTGSDTSINSIKKNKKNCFLIDDVTTNEKKKKMEFYASFYNFLERGSKNENCKNEKWNNKNCLLYYQYSKLIRENTSQNDRKENIINFYTPTQKWVTFNNNENKSMVNEIADIKRKINFNNNLKKKNRFIFYCKAKENKIEMSNIFTKEECDEFNELMEKLKFHEKLYTTEILEEGLESNLHIQDYHFNKEVLKKLNIFSDANNENADDNVSKMIKLIPHVPLSIFLQIFDN